MLVRCGFAVASGRGAVGWLPEDFEHPLLVPVGAHHHLRPIRAADVGLDMPAVMGSQQRLRGIFGTVWGWPPSTITIEEDREDLLHHERKIAAHLSSNDALLDDDETELLGCVYIDPSEKVRADAEVSWWVRDEYLGTDVEGSLNRLVPKWLASSWPFTSVRYVGRDLSWDEWLALPRLSRPE